MKAERKWLLWSASMASLASSAAAISADRRSWRWWGGQIHYRLHPDTTIRTPRGERGAPITHLGDFTDWEEFHSNCNSSLLEVIFGIKFWRLLSNLEKAIALLLFDKHRDIKVLVMPSSIAETDLKKYTSPKRCWTRNGAYCCLSLLAVFEANERAGYGERQTKCGLGRGCWQNVGLSPRRVERRCFDVQDF